jgi:hypothetical protein
MRAGASRARISKTTKRYVTSPIVIFCDNLKKYIMTTVYSNPVWWNGSELVPLGSGAPKNAFFQFSVSSSTDNPISTNTALYSNGFSYGELVTSFFLFVIMIILIFKTIPSIRWRVAK